MLTLLHTFSFSLFKYRMYFCLFGFSIAPQCLIPRKVKKNICRIFRFSHRNIYWLPCFFFLSLSFHSLIRLLKYCSCRQYKRKLSDELLKFLLKIVCACLPQVNVPCPLQCYYAAVACTDIGAFAPSLYV